MNQREEVLQAWDRYSAHAYPSPQLDKARAFFQLVRDRHDLCWEDLVTQFRASYYDALDPVSTVLMSTDNPLVMYNVTRFADVNNPQEASAMKRFISQSDSNKHQFSLAALAAKPAMQPELLNKPNLPDSVRAVLNPRPPAAVADPGSAPAAEARQA
jgi:hypothetical protein